MRIFDIYCTLSVGVHLGGMPIGPFILLVCNVSLRRFWLILLHGMLHRAFVRFLFDCLTHENRTFFNLRTQKRSIHSTLNRGNFTTRSAGVRRGSGYGARLLSLRSRVQFLQ